MKLFVSVATFLALLLGGLDQASGCCCCRKKAPPAKGPDTAPAQPGNHNHNANGLPNAKVMNVTLAVSGMTCNSCAAKVKKSLAALPGVREVHVDLKKEQAEVAIDPARYDERALLKAVKDAGYGARVVK